VAVSFKTRPQDARILRGMKPRIKVLTLAVADLERALGFYRDGLGFETKGITGTQFENGAVAFFHLDNDLILALWPATSLSKDARITATDARLGAVSIGYILSSKGEVDALVSRARKAGAIVTDAPKDRFWGGYSGYFHDPDGHLWEIAWNPEWAG
jgi:catechol 2,3-dioxygenase-like lactoylglutathione lyase family enzyme